MLLADVEARIEANVSTLAGRMQSAAQLAELIARKALPQVTPAGFVLPLGKTPRGEGEAATGVFTQMVDERVGVILVLRGHGDATGKTRLPDLDTLIEATIAAIVGWGPDDYPGVFRIAGARLGHFVTGTIVYELDFAIQRQLRIVS